jgi:hypothetical protein
VSRRARSERPVDVIGEFLELAAHVRRSALAQRLDLATLGQRWRVSVNLDGDSSIGQRDPVTEPEVEQAALRLRPAMLQSEYVYAPRVLDELGRRIHDERWRRERLKPLRDAWVNFDKTMSWSASVADATEESPMRSDREIAKDHLYGNLLHRDVDRRRRIALLSDTTLLYATTLYVKDGVLLCEATSRFIIDAVDNQKLAPPTAWL